MPQRPQLSVSVAVITQRPEQKSSPGLQELAHTPALVQSIPAPHGVPQVKQVEGEGPHIRPPQSLGTIGWVQRPASQVSLVHAFPSSVQRVPEGAATQRPAEQVSQSPHRTPTHDGATGEQVGYIS